MTKAMIGMRKEMRWAGLVGKAMEEIK